MVSTIESVETRVESAEKSALSGHSPARDTALLFMRIWVGAMMITHGWGKVFGGIDGFTEGIAEMGFPAPRVFAWLAALSELAGGMLLGLGLATRVNAFLIAVTMGVAAFIRHAPDPIGRKELPITYMVIAIALMLIGPGRYALDRFISDARRKRS